MPVRVGFFLNIFIVPKFIQSPCVCLGIIKFFIDGEKAGQAVQYNRSEIVRQGHRQNRNWYVPLITKRAPVIIEER